MVWKNRADLPIERPARVAAAVHVFFPELLPGVLRALATIPVEFDLLVTNATGMPLSIDASAMPNVREIRVLDVDNQGRDMLPLIHLVNAGLLDPYELVVKVHTKKSQWRMTHDLGGVGGVLARGAARGPARINRAGAAVDNCLCDAAGPRRGHHRR